MKKTLLSIAFAAVAMLPNVAQAQCVGTQANDLLGNGTVVATACGFWSGPGVNDTQADVNNWLTGLGYPTLTGFNKDEAPNELDAPFYYSSAGNTGTITFLAPFSGPFVVALKAGSGLGYYYFQSGTYSTMTYNTTDYPPNSAGLSHATVYGGSSTTVPEPATFGLVAAGMIGLAGVARRRRNQA
jgi:hypothetical protein